MSFDYSTAFPDLDSMIQSLGQQGAAVGSSPNVSQIMTDVNQTKAQDINNEPSDAAFADAGPPPGMPANATLGEANDVVPEPKNPPIPEDAETPEIPQENLWNRIKDAYNTGSNGTGIGNAIGTALSPITNTASEGLNAIGSAVHGVTSPILENPYLQQVLGTVGQASATSGIGPSLNQAYQLIGGVTGNPLPPVYGGSANGSSKPAPAGTALPTSQDDIIANAQNTINTWQPMTLMPGPRQAMAQEMVKNAQEVLSKARDAQVAERANAASIGTFKPGDSDMQDLATLGQTSARMHELIGNLANDVSSASQNPNGSSQRILADFGAISKDENLMQSIKRQNPALAGEIQSSFDEFGSPLASASGLLVPEKLKGSLQGLVNNAMIEDHSFQTKLGSSQTPNMQMAGTRLNEYYGQPYFPQAPNDPASQMQYFTKNVLSNQNLNALSNDATTINTATSKVGAQSAVAAGRAAVESGGKAALATIKDWSGLGLQPPATNVDIPKATLQQYAPIIVQARSGDKASIAKLQKNNIPF